MKIVGPNAWGYFWVKNPFKRLLFYFLGHPHPYGRLRAYGLLQYLSKGSEILDMGCGEGVFSRELYKRNFKVTGLDIDSDAISAARTIAHNANLKINYLVADALDSKLPNNSFAQLICTDVIEHVDDPDKGLQEISRIVAPNGEAIITVPSPLYLYKNYFNHDFSEQLKSIGHQHSGWYAEELASMLKKHDLELISYRYFGHPILRFSLEAIYIIIGGEGFKGARKDLYNVSFKALLVYLALLPAILLDVLWPSHARGAFLVAKAKKRP